MSDFPHVQANKYQCFRCKGTGEEPEPTGTPIEIVAWLQKHLDDLSIPRDEHDAMEAAAQTIERMTIAIQRLREDRPYVVGFSDGFDAAMLQATPDPDAIVQAALEAAADHLAQIASKTPLGHENVQHGASTYNWLRSHEKFIRTLAADREARAKIIETAIGKPEQANTPAPDTHRQRVGFTGGV